MRILLAEDDHKVVEALAKYLSDAGYQVTAVSDGQSALVEGLTGKYDVILMDVMLPIMSGIEVIRKLRASDVRSVMIIISAKGQIADRIAGLEVGADDYLTKPFAPRELLARIKAITRRHTPTRSNDGSLHFGDLCFDEERGILFKDDESIQLPPKEGNIVVLFMTHPEQPFSKGDIIRNIWGDEDKVTNNNVEAYIHLIRNKLKFLGSNVRIKTIRRVGYQMLLANPNEIDDDDLDD